MGQTLSYVPKPSGKCRQGAAKKVSGMEVMLKRFKREPCAEVIMIMEGAN